MAKVERRSGSYTTRVSLTDPVTGKRSQVRVTARTKRALDDEIARVRSEWNAGTYVEPDRTTLAEWLPAWHATYKAAPVSRYRRSMHIRRYIAADAIGRVPLGRLRYAHVQDWVDRLSATLSHNSVRNVVTTLNMALGQAQRRRLIAVNPCAGLDLPPAGQRRWRVLSESEVHTLIDGTRDEPDHALYVLAVMLGLRRGELLALDWDDVDLSGGVLRVERTMTADETGRRMVGDRAKSAAGRRPIRLPSICLEALREHRKRQLQRRIANADVWEDSNAVFDRVLGQRDNERAFHRGYLVTRARLGLPDDLRFHDLRHTAASHMIRAGVPIPTVAAILGHSSPAITMRVYSHVMAEMEDEAAALIDGMYSAHSDHFLTKRG